jgi:hypothetical protein
MAVITPNTTCFENIIGLRGACDETPPTSGLYINDVGVSMNELNEIVNDDYIDGIDLFNKKLSFAIFEVTQKLHTMLSPKYKMRSVIENMRAGYYNNDLKTSAAIPNTYKGIQFELTNTDSYLDFQLVELSLTLASNVGNIPIDVIDLMTGSTIATFTVATTANIPTTVFPNIKIKSTRKRMNIFIGYNSTGLTSIQSTLNIDGNCSSCTGKYYIQNQFVRTTPGTIGVASQKINANIAPVSDTGGLSIVYSIACNHSDWLCSINNVIAMPILWKTAALLMEHAMTIAPNDGLTPRTINRDLLDARLKMYNDKFIESYESVIQNIVLPSDEKCFACNNMIRTTYMIPS